MSFQNCDVNFLQHGHVTSIPGTLNHPMIMNMLVRFIWGGGFGDLIDPDSPVDQLKYAIALAGAAAYCVLKEQSVQPRRKINFTPLESEDMFNAILERMKTFSAEQMVHLKEFATRIVLSGESQHVTVKPSPYDLN
jgi:hypothetical protein